MPGYVFALSTHASMIDKHIPRQGIAMKRYRAIFGEQSKHYREIKNFEKSLNNNNSPVYNVFAHGISGITVVRVS